MRLFTKNSGFNHLLFERHLVVPEEVSRFKGEEQGHVVVHRVFAVNVVRLVLQQAASLVDHPVRRVNGHHCLALLKLHVNSYVQLGPLHLHSFAHILLLLLTQRLEHCEGDLPLPLALKAVIKPEKDY